MRRGRRVVWGLGLLLIMGSAAAATAPAAGSTHGAAYVPGEVLVRFKPTVNAWSRANTVSAFAATSRSLGKSAYTLIKLNPAYGSVPSAVNSLAADPNVESVQPNYIYHSLATTPNDTDFAQQWGLNNLGQSITGGDYTTDNPPGVAGDDIDATQAWDHITNCSGVTVAVLDTGINYTQKDLAGNMWNGGSAYPHHGYDEVDGDNDPLPVGGAEQHGTHVAGIIGADGNNALGTTGVCWKASIMSVRVLGPDGSGTTANIVQGIDFAVAHGAKVINMSLGGGSYDSAFSTAITYAQSHGVVVVVAAGNDGQDNDTTPHYPCNYTQDNLICVAALDQAYSLATFSDYGAGSVDVGAPGTNILSTWGGPILVSSLAGFPTSGATGWGYDTTHYTLPLLYAPTNSTSGSFDDKTWAYFSQNSTTYPNLTAEALSYSVSEQTTTNQAYFNSAYATGNNNPFGSSGIQLQHATGFLYQQQEAYDLSSCITANGCAIGFELTGTSGTSGNWARVYDFTIQTQQTNASVYRVLSGTSMATPFVSGIATMLYAYNPQDDYHDVVNAILNGGTPVGALSSVTTTGNAVNAMGALAYISPPSGVTATVQ